MKKRIANWGNYPTIETDERSFSYPEQLRDLLAQGLEFIPRGNGRCYGDSSLAATTISTLKFNNILSFDRTAGIFECQAGLLLDQILDVIVPAGWFLPVTPGTKFITVGGAVASDVHGKNHHVDGSFSNYVLEMDIVLASGETILSTPVINPDLFEATCGGMGLTGIICRVKFRLRKIETSFVRHKQIKAANLEALLRLFEENKEFTYSVAWIDCLKRGHDSGRSILLLGEHAQLNELSQKQKQNPLKVPNKNQFSLPIQLPSWMTNAQAAKAFNFLYYFKNFNREKDQVIGYESFFYPLDSILNWNRGYGKKGFVQYQFVLPLESKMGLIEILNRITNKGFASFLAVLKVFGKQEGLISFPREGYTLALDFPVKDGLLDFLDELDLVVIQFGGRIYLSKDARMKPGILRQGYPGLNKFKEIVNKYNPESKIHSIQSDRLLITIN